VHDPATGKRVNFEDASPELLGTEQQCWVLHPGDAWHGFDDLEDDYCMLDPIKVTVLMPGVQDDGSLGPKGFPASLLTAYLHARGIEVEKTSDFGVLFLFSLGITKAKWSTLLAAMLDFKHDYDEDVPLSRIMPHLVADHPEPTPGWACAGSAIACSRSCGAPRRCRTCRRRSSRSPKRACRRPMRTRRSSATASSACRCRNWPTAPSRRASCPTRPASR
jgi:hypothetical protein